MTIKGGIIKPHFIILLTYTLSFTAWIFPSFGIFRKGFDKNINLTTLEWLISAIVFIITLFSISYIYKLFSKTSKKGNKKNTQKLYLSNKIYILFIFIATIGILYTYSSIVFSFGIDGIITIVVSGQANQLKHQLYENYSAGFPSLRYAAIIVGTILVYRRLSGVKNNNLDIIAFILLLLVALIASRLALISSILMGIYLYLKLGGELKLNIAKFSVVAMLFITIINAFNWSRNRGFYESMGHNFWTAGVSEILTYLGSPFQGMLTAIRSISTNLDLDNHRNYSGIEPSLTTNSTLLEFITTFGASGLLLLIAMLMLIAALIGILEQYSSGKYTLAAAWLVYILAENWRVNLLPQGISIAILILSITIVWTASKRLKFKNE